MARRIDPTRAITGLATVFDATPKSGKPWGAQHFDIATGLELAILLRLDHLPIFHSWGVTPDLGTVERFVAVRYPVPGLLVLGEIGEASGYGDSINDEKSEPRDAGSTSIGGWRRIGTSKVGLCRLGSASQTGERRVASQRILDDL
jgi:hypothetical protein